ncbi:MAG: hypothetical protein DRN20_04240 [Thermoplasmata archaeon]|nr:MAG: hypothetical protein DRN20_04240 [Thermoplasmata archaeon]
MDKDMDKLEEIVEEIISSVGSVGVCEDKFREYRVFEDNDYRVGAVDGSTSIVLDCASFIVYLIRVGYEIHGNSDIIERCWGPEIGIISANNVHEIYTREFNEKPDTDDLTLIVQRIRELREWMIARELIRELDEGDVLLLDGNLTPGIKKMESFVDDVVNNAIKAGVHLVGISKRSSINHGHVPIVPYIAYIGNKIMKNKLWYYPLGDYVETKNGKVYAVRYHPASSIGFRTDIIGDEPAEIFGKIARFSNHPGYLGYPYPLASIHNRVFIDSSTRQYWREKLSMRILEKKGENLVNILSFNFHDILDMGV